ncbi:hypothetical protein SAMN05216298_0311 [Glycomyces sambucus]|uniref:Tetratricopeptide repeat-containing protein n=1 Tax=Glycomyces sambucus TaxID=380244 RepID=A0A1G9CFQ7_9ACTN|nr:hypothetical protein [Glycomyces sambucus]SDK50478.1 hypothetical protein SAMN05216298_0311 [Glycomyces sambucus]
MSGHNAMRRLEIRYDAYLAGDVGALLAPRAGREIAAALSSEDYVDGRKPDASTLLLPYVIWYRSRLLADPESQTGYQYALDAFFEALAYRPHLVPSEVVDALVRESLASGTAGNQAVLAMCLVDAAVTSAGPGHLPAAIELFRSGLATAEVSDEERLLLTCSCGIAYALQGSRTGDLADLDTAVDILHGVVDRTPAAASSRPRRLTALGNALTFRFDRCGDAAALDRAGEVAQEAVDLEPDEPAGLVNLSGLIWRRYELRRQRSDLDAAIVLAERGLAAATRADDTHRAGALSTLAGTLKSRYLCSGDAADLDRAVAALREAAQRSRRAADPQYPVIASNLAGALALRYGSLRERGDLNAALDAAERSVRAAPGAGPLRRTCLIGLAWVNYLRFRDSGDGGHLDEAITALEAAGPGAPSDALYGPLLNLLRRVRAEPHGDPTDAAGPLPGAFAEVETLLSAQQQRTALTGPAFKP